MGIDCLTEGVHANINYNITLQLPPQVQTKKDQYRQTSTDKQVQIPQVQTNKYRQKRIAWRLHKHPMRNVQNYQYTIVLQKKLQHLHQNLNFLNHVTQWRSQRR